MQETDQGAGIWVGLTIFIYCCVSIQVRMAFAQFDTSGDDKLDYREFCEMIRRREEEQKEGRK